MTSLINEVVKEQNFMKCRFFLFFTFVSYFLLISSGSKAIGQTSSEQKTKKTSITHFKLFQKNTCKIDADCVLVDKSCCGWSAFPFI